MSSTDAPALRALIRLADSGTRPSKATSFTESASDEETASDLCPRVLLTANPPTRVSTSSNSNDHSAQSLKSVLREDVVVSAFST